MKSFSDICKDFFATNNCDKLVNQLQLIDRSMTKEVADYTAIGCEFILNGMNTDNDYFSLAEMIETHYEYDNVMSHCFNLINNWDTFLFYSPLDFRGLIFDFSSLYSEGKVICYDGLNGPKNLKKVTEYTIEEFLAEYGLSRMYSISHWNVNWKNIGVNWNN